MKIYDFPESVSLRDRFMPWAKAYEEEISKALSDKFAYSYKPRIEDAKDDVLNCIGALLLLSCVFLMAFTNFTTGVIAGIAAYWIISFIAKFCAKKCAIRIFESISKHEVIEQCFVQILNREFDEAITDEQREIVNDFFKYAIHRTYDISFKYKT